MPANLENRLEKLEKALAKMMGIGEPIFILCGGLTEEQVQELETIAVQIYQKRGPYPLFIMDNLWRDPDEPIWTLEELFENTKKMLYQGAGVEYLGAAGLTQERSEKNYEG